MNWLLLSAQALAATLTVGSSGEDYTTIQQAIDSSLDGDVIDVSTDTYNEALEFNGRQLTLLGNQSWLLPPGSTDAIRWLNSADASVSGFQILPNGGRAFYSQDSDAQIANCTVSGAGNNASFNGGAIYVDGGSLNLSNTQIDTSAGAWGGAVYAINGAELDWNQVTITATTGDYGGAIYLDDVTLNAVDLTISDTEAGFSGGGLYLVGATVTLSDFELSDARGDETWGAGIYAHSTDLAIESGLITDCEALDYLSGYGGGAIRATSASSLDFYDVHIGNSAAYFGGGMALSSSTIAILSDFSASNNLAANTPGTATGGALHVGASAQVSCLNCIFDQNTADLGGAVAVDTDGIFTDEGGLYQLNVASAQGGAVHINNSALVDFTDSSFEQNTAAQGGALWYTDSSNTPTAFSGLSFDANSAGYAGGALAIIGPANLLISSSKFLANTTTAGSAGAIHLQGFTGATYSLAIEDSLFEANSAVTEGGAIVAGANGQLLIRDSTFDTNTAATDGGAIASEQVDSLTIIATLFRANASGVKGGAWAHSSGPAVASASVWLENNSVSGGAIAATDSQDNLSLINNSFVANEAYGEGAHLWAEGGSVDSTNNIFAYGAGGGGVYGDSAAAASMILQYCAAWNNLGDSYVGQLVDPTGTNGNIADDPLFRDYLAANPSDLDLHLASGSPCIDAGDPGYFDLDGSRSDIGAYGGLDVPTYDNDGDGHLDLTDCDDEDPSIYPATTEIPYDTIDQDCDGADLGDVDGDGAVSELVGGDDCDDDDADIFPNATENYYDGVDQNCDGLSDYDADADGEDSDLYGGTDCDDTDPTVSSVANETLYDGVDQNCDGRSDFDADRDGYDSSDYGGVDCDDTDSAIFPGATEIAYDLVDQDCNGSDLTDVDGDGYDAQSIGGTDCDDNNASINPGATDLPYDGVDQDCDGLSDYDADHDGYDDEAYGGQDCDDSDNSVNPLATEIYYDGVDQDCDGLSDYDYDQDGEDADHSGGTDCNDTDATVNTSASETFYDGVDQDCSGGSDYDYDGDGYDAFSGGGIDCDDNNALINPSAAEIAYDGVDQDCNGADWDDVDADGFVGTLGGGTDCDDNDPAINPGVLEIWYDDVDQDCDGLSDYDADYDSFDSDDYGGTDCDDNEPKTYPGAPETWYDGVDADCAGDDDYDADSDGYPIDEDCDDARPEAYPGAPELDNGLDDDCDGFSEDVDRDGDGLSDWDEWERGTDPERADSDGDGLSDGEEAPTLPPRDTDGDGLIDALDADDDGDGIPTLIEIFADVDGDGIPDRDVDGDGIPNHLDTDSDGDSLSDADEGALDSDGDGIPEYIDYTGDYIGGGCGSGQSGGLLIGLLAFARRWRGWAAAGATLVSTPAFGQSFEVESFQWLGQPGAVNSPIRLSVPVDEPRNTLSVGSLTTYSKNPLLETQPTGPEVVVRELVTTQLRVTSSPVERLQVHASLPVFATGSRQGERFHGLGDLRIGLNGTITEGSAGRPGFGLSLLSWIPTGHADLGLGHTYASMGMIVAAKHAIGPLHLAANLGARIGPSDAIRNLNPGTGPLLGLSAGVVPLDSLGIHLECVSQGSNGWERLALELFASAQWRLPQGFWFSGGWGTGLTNAVGSPAWRGVANVGWRWVPPPKSAIPDPLVVSFPQEKKPVKPRPTISEVDPQLRPLAELGESKIILHDRIYFEEGSAVVLPQSTPILQAVLEILFEHLEIQHLLIEGHTNHRGTYTVNLDLSGRRSEAVMAWLVQHGVNPHRLVSKGYGSHRPIVDPTHPDALEINRRVEFTILRPDPVP
jgi:predicted outer membrane repeat protein